MGQHKASQVTCCNTKSHAPVPKGAKKVSEDIDDYTAIVKKADALLKCI